MKRFGSTSYTHELLKMREGLLTRLNTWNFVQLYVCLLECMADRNMYVHEGMCICLYIQMDL